MESTMEKIKLKNLNGLLLSTFGCVLLSACANSPSPPRTKIVDTRTIDFGNSSRITVLTQNAINGDVVEDTNNTLNVVSKADTATLVGLKTLQIAATLLGGGSSNTDGFSKEQLKGNSIPSVKNKTMDYLNPELDTMLKGMNTYTGKDAKIIVQPYKFKLIYEGLGNNNYEFKYSTTISVGDFDQVCSSNDLLSSERIKPIDEWEKNNYELTQVTTQKIIKNCFEKINQAENKAKLRNALLKSTLNGHKENMPNVSTSG